MATFKILLGLLTLCFNTILMVLFVVPILFTFLLPIAIYRFLIQVTAKVVKKNLISIVPCRDALFTNDNAVTKPSSTILLVNFVKGDMTLESLQKSVQNYIFEGAIQSSHPYQTKYPRLLQHFENFGGFVFRKWETNFDIRNHVKEWEKSEGEKCLQVNSDDLYNIRRKLLNEPYKAETSPWEFILLRNYKSPETSISCSVLLCKVHHGVLDGFSLMKLLVSLSAGEEDVISTLIPNTVSKELTPWQNFGIFSELLFKAPSIVMEQMKATEVDPDNIFHPENIKGTKCLKRHPISTSLPISVFKNAAKQSETSFTAVTLAGFAGGIRAYLISRKIKVPKSIDFAITLPWPGHSESQLRNNFTFATLKIAIGSQDHLARLRNVHEQFLRIKGSSTPAFYYCLSFLCGMLPTSMISKILRRTPSSILFSSIPGPQEPVKCLDQDYILPVFEGGYGKGPLGMGVSIASYNGLVGIAINPSDRVIPTKKDSEDLLRCITNEIQLIHDASIV